MNNDDDDTNNNNNTIVYSQHIFIYYFGIGNIFMQKKWQQNQSKSSGLMGIDLRLTTHQKGDYTTINMHTRDY